MNAIEKAVEWCCQYGYEFRDEVAFHACHGVAILSKRGVLLAEQKYDTWFIFLAVGESWIGVLESLAPYKLANVEWFRQKTGKYHSYPWEKAIALGRIGTKFSQTNHHGRKKITTTAASHGGTPATDPSDHRNPQGNHRRRPFSQAGRNEKTGHAKHNSGRRR